MWLVAALFVGVSSGVCAAEEPARIVSAAEDVLYAYGGTIVTTAGSSQLSASRNPWLIGLGYVGSYEDIAPWRPDVALLMFSRDYDNTIPPPAWGTIDDYMRLQTLALALGVRRELELSPQFVAYGVGGVGLYYSKLIVGGSSFGFPGVVDDRDTTANLYAGVGAEWRTSRYYFSLDYRYMPFNGSFSDFDVHSAAIGGELLFIGFGAPW